MSEAESWKLLMLHALPCSNQFLIGLSSVCSKKCLLWCFFASSLFPFSFSVSVWFFSYVFGVFSRKKRYAVRGIYERSREINVIFYVVWCSFFLIFSYAVCAFDGREVEVYFCVFRVSLGVIRIVRNFKLSFIINAGFSIGWHGFMFAGDMMMFFSHFGLASYVKKTGRS